MKEAGAPVHLLDTQYRMHPQIRNFPARYFYEDKLKDQVKWDDERFFENWYYSPYVVFNMRSGSSESIRGTSVCNDVEAQFSVRLLTTFLREFPDSPVKDDQMAILTPYRKRTSWSCLV
jgi:senataxin